jgi:hypothetical protein
MLPEFVWDAAVLERNPFTFPQVKTVLDGIAVGGHRLADQDQIIRLAVGSTELYRRVRNRTFSLTKDTFCFLHACVAEHEALEWGHFRGDGKNVDDCPKRIPGESGERRPPRTEAGGHNLNQVFADGISAIKDGIESPLEQGMAFFLFCSLQQFFSGGNKRTSRLMMNGILMSGGIDAISVPASRVNEFNDKMMRFHFGMDATEMMSFLVDCHPEADDARRRAIGWRTGAGPK